LLLFAGAFAVGSIVLLELGSRWSLAWQQDAVKQSGIFCYRKKVGLVAAKSSAGL
jgi:hypothetical protein